MKAKEYLSQINVYRYQIEALARKRAELEHEAAGVKAITYDRDRVQTSPENRLEKIMARLDDIDRRYSRRIEQYHKEVAKREKQIAGLDTPLYAELLALRYIDGCSLQQAADILHERHPDKQYNEDYIRRVHGWALMEFQKKYL